MKSRFARWLRAALALAGVLLVLPRSAQAQPSLSHVVPSAVAPGTTTDVTLHGTKLNGALRLWTSFPALVEAAPVATKDGKQATCKFTLPQGTPCGIGGIVVANAEGASDVVYCLVDDLPSHTAKSNHHSLAEAQDVALPIAIDGESGGTLSDYYRFSAKAGQQISCEVVATRLGWDFDALVRVLDAGGNELLIADDDPATGADARFVFIAPREGFYLLEVRDNRYKPGGRYRLRLGDFPLASAASPLFAQHNARTEVGIGGPLAEAFESATILPLSNGASSIAVSLTARAAGRQSSGWASLAITNLPVIAEAPSSDPPVIKVPAVACGTLAAPRERDVFAFEATKGVPLRFRAISRSAGSPAILTLRVLDAAGKQLAESPVTDSDEPVLSYTPQADGKFQLAVEELANRGGSDYTYAVECTSGPQFALVLKNDKNNRLKQSVPSGGALYLDVQCQRAGYDGPITLAIESDRAGWQVANNTIPARTNEVRMYVQPPIDFDAAELAAIRVIGRGAVGGHEIAVPMSTTIPLRLARPQTPYPPRWHDGTIFVSGLGAKPGFFTVGVKSSSVDVARGTEKAQVTVDFERTDAKFKDAPLVVVPVGLPAGVTAEVKRNGNGAKETYDINLKLPKDLPASQYAYRFFAYAELAGQGRGVMSGDLLLNVSPAK